MYLSNCKIGSKLGIISQRALEEQQEIRELLQFIPETKTSPGYYQIELPLKADYGSHIVDNYDQANDANLRMLTSLESSQTDTKAIQDSFLDLLNRVQRVPSEKNKSIYPHESSSHSTKVRICWDLPTPSPRRPF